MEAIQITRYGLKNSRTGDYASVFRSSNDGADFCGDSSYEFSTTTERDEIQTWAEAWEAEWARTNSTPWYNSGRQNPQHPRDWKPEEWEVVSIEMLITEHQVIPTMPTNRTVWEADGVDERTMQMWESQGLGADIFRLRNYFRNLNKTK